MKRLKTGWDNLCVDFYIEQEINFPGGVEMSDDEMRTKLKPYKMVGRMTGHMYIPKTNMGISAKMYGTYKLKLTSGRIKFPWRRHRNE